MPVEVPVDRSVIVTLFAEDLHGQDLDVGQRRFRPRCLSQPPNVTIL